MYKITIEQLTEKADPDYPKSVIVYEQMVEKLDIRDLVSYINDEDVTDSVK
jgi:hypothetical protein